MKFLRSAVVAQCVLASSVFAQDVASSAESNLRPPAVPLITCDPYFSIWSMTNELNAGPTRHWTGHPDRTQGLRSVVRIDGKPFRLMGDQPANDVPAMKQTGRAVLPTRTIYTFASDAGVEVKLTFTTPLLPDDLSIASRPVTYVTWTARATDNKSHDVSVCLGAGADIAVNTEQQEVKGEPVTVPGLVVGRVGSVEQPVLEKHGDDLRIDWGHLYLAGPEGSEVVYAAGAPASFAKGEKPADSWVKDASPAGRAPILTVSLSLGSVGDAPVSRHVLLAYDDEYSIRYFNEDLKPYWRKSMSSAAELLTAAEKDYASLMDRCDAFDKELGADLAKLGGDSYVQLGVLAWRQALAAQKICTDANGQPLMFSKENFSNGCISTVDVLYPAAPQMLAFSPNMLKASLVPLMEYSASPRWKHNSAPHDLGQYPHATGQVYGGGEHVDAMPVEESGNMLILLAALARTEGNAEFSRKYWPILGKWNQYLVEKGLDPENQLCTDDFAGHIARNANLSAKAIMGIASYGMIADMLGHKEEAEKATATAKDYAKKWMEMGADGDHTMLVFGEKGKGTWSQKYNIAWDTILGLNVFPPEVAQKEIAFYKTKMNKYGLPLDSRKEYTKIDWELWTATLAEKPEDFRMIVDAAAKWVNETPDRVPMSDWYETVNGHKSGFQARSVVGGLFIPFLKDKALWEKYAKRDKTQLGNWAQADFTPPVTKVIVPAADTEPAEWHYTTEEPPREWNAPKFDDSKWKVGKSGFGAGGPPNAHIGTDWTTSDIWLRREVTLPEGKLEDARLWVHHDEDVDVYINGVRAFHGNGYSENYGTARISPRALATLKPGKNVIAVKCHQTTNGQYIDVGIVDIEQPHKKH